MNNSKLNKNLNTSNKKRVIVDPEKVIKTRPVFKRFTIL